MKVTLWKQSALGASVGLPVSYSKHQSDCLVSTQPTKGHWASGHPHEVCSWWFVQRHSHQWLAGGHFVEVTLGVLIMFLHALLHCWSEWRATRCPTCYGNVSVICKHYRNLGITKTCASWWVQMTTVNSKFKCYCYVNRNHIKVKELQCHHCLTPPPPPVGPPDQYIRHFTGCLYIFSSPQKKIQFNIFFLLYKYIFYIVNLSQKK